MIKCLGFACFAIKILSHSLCLHKWFREGQEGQIAEVSDCDPSMAASAALASMGVATDDTWLHGYNVDRCSQKHYEQTGHEIFYRIQNLI